MPRAPVCSKNTFTASLRFFFFAIAAVLSGCIGLPKGAERVSADLERTSGRTLESAAPGVIAMPRGVSVENGLTEDEAVSIALCNNAVFLETLADLGIARADVVQAGVISNPTLTLLFPTGSKQLEFTAKLGAEVLWLRPLKLKAARLDYEKTAKLLVQNGLNLIRDVKVAFAEMLATEERLRLAEESATLSARIENLARARVAAGDVSELEVSTVGIDTLQGRELASRSRYDVNVARERLRNLLGLGWEGTPINVVAPTHPPRITASSSALVEVALAARPDLRAAELAVEAASGRRGLAIAEIFTATGILDANRIEADASRGRHIEKGPGLDVGIPIFNQNQGGRAKARAQFEKAARHYIAVRDRILLEVREAHIRCGQAQESYDSWNARIVPPLVTAVDQSQEAYQAGNATILLVLESSRKLTDARAQRAAATVELRRSTAELERAIGGKLPQ